MFYHFNMLCITLLRKHYSRCFTLAHWTGLDYVVMTEESAIFRVCARYLPAYNAALPEFLTPPSSRASARRVQGRCTSIGWVGLKISMF